MKLAKYLANYLLQEDEEGNLKLGSGDLLEYYIQEGIEAFESTENVKILVMDKKIGSLFASFSS